jgi:hypothetical protein
MNSGGTNIHSACPLEIAAMADCEKLEKCPFFNDKMAAMPSTAATMKRRYCGADKENCARYQLSSKGIAVPPDLFPNQRDRALEILAGA